MGSIERVMIGKRDGKVSYAVLGFGGFLGIGDDYYPLPWHSLTYNTELGGYQTAITKDQLKGAPKYGNSDATWDWKRCVTHAWHRRLLGHSCAGISVMVDKTKPDDQAEEDIAEAVERSYGKKIVKPLREKDSEQESE